MIEPDHPRLSIVRQCELASISRSSFYRLPTAESEDIADASINHVLIGNDVAACTNYESSARLSIRFLGRGRCLRTIRLSIRCCSRRSLSTLLWHGGKHYGEVSCSCEAPGIYCFDAVNQGREQDRLPFRSNWKRFP
jgi:hypothetical protein